MADEFVATFELSAGLHALAGKSKTAGLDVKLIIVDGNHTDTDWWACLPAAQLSHLGR